MSHAATGVVIAIVTTAAFAPLALSVREGRPAAHEAPSPKLPETLDVVAIDAWLAAQPGRMHAVGLSVAIVSDGEIVLQKGYGKASRETGAAVDEHTEFALGSITKQFTCAAALLLEQDGKLSFDDPVAKYFPQLARANDITLADLGAHVAGYPDNYPLDFLDDRFRHPADTDAVLQQYAGGKLDFEPRTRWSYSNTGFLLLGRVVEKVSGMPLGQFLAKRVFEPLGMADTHLEPPAGTPGLAQGYTSFALGDPEKAEREAPGWIGGAGALYASAGDLARWNVALMQGRVLEPASVARMTTPRTLPDGRSTEYGCGLGTGRREGETTWGHSGAVNGFLAYSTMLPRTTSSVVVLSNYDQVDAGATIRKKLVDLLFQAHDTRPPVVHGPPAKEAARDMFAQLQSGTVDRAHIGKEYGELLTEERVRATAARLGPFGPPKEVTVERRSERGGMEVAQVTFVFERRKLSGTMFRSPDGVVQQLLVVDDE